MIGAKEVIKCECEHLIHSISPSPHSSPARCRPVGWGQGKDQIDPQAPQPRGLRMSDIWRRKAEARAQARDTGTDRTSSHASALGREAQLPSGAGLVRTPIL